MAGRIRRSAILFRRGIGNLEMTAGTKASLPGSGAHDYIDSSA